MLRSPPIAHRKTVMAVILAKNNIRMQVVAAFISLLYIAEAGNITVGNTGFGDKFPIAQFALTPARVENPV